MSQLYQHMNYFPINTEILIVAKYYSITISESYHKLYVKVNLKSCQTSQQRLTQLDEIFNNEYIIQNPLTKQLIFDLYLTQARNLNDFVYFTNYAIRLQSIGMKFYWSHLIRYPQPETKELSHVYNQTLIQFGIENPNQLLYSDFTEPDGSYVNGRSYSPLYSLIKVTEGFLRNDSCDLFELMQLFQMYIQIGCDPNYEHCTWYTAGDFPIRLSLFINPIYEYHLDDIDQAKLCRLTCDDLDSETEYGIDSLNSLQYLKEKPQNLALLRIIVYVVEQYQKRNYPITLSDLHVKIKTKI